jgi:hypothetical protein
MIGNKNPKGFTIFFAMLVGGLSLAVGLSIYDLTIREIDLSATITQSQYAIYAADSGAECALYWDSHAPVLNGVPSAFGTSTASLWPASGANLTCNGQDISTLWGTPTKGASVATTSFQINLSPSATGPCVLVEVGKLTDVPTRVLFSNVLAHGYNTCSTAVSPRLERVLQVSY